MQWIAKYIHLEQNNLIAFGSNYVQLTPCLNMLERKLVIEEYKPANDNMWKEPRNDGRRTIEDRRYNKSLTLKEKKKY